MAVVMIGVDPPKGSHTAVAVGADESPLSQVRVRAPAARAQRLLTWAKSWPARTWAVEGAGGLGHLLAQRLVAAGGGGPGRAARAGRRGAAARRAKYSSATMRLAIFNGGVGYWNPPDTQPASWWEPWIKTWTWRPPIGGVRVHA